MITNSLGMMKLYHSRITTQPLCKNGSEKFGVTASTKVAFGPDALVIEFNMHGKTTEDATSKLLAFLSDDDHVDLEQIDTNGTMTRQEAVLAMKLGERVTHRYFTKNGFIRMDQGKIIDENNLEFNSDLFWQFHSADGFNHGWIIKVEGNGA